MLPFTAEQFLDVFRRYNEAIWPAHLVAYVLALAALSALYYRGGRYWALSMSVLGAMWLWNGIAYHFLFFRPINPIAAGFALMFVIQGLLFLNAGIQRPPATPVSARATFFGFTVVFYATTVYPLLGALQGHGYPANPAFGVAPCPTTIFTFGLLMLIGRRARPHLLVLPIVWALIGTTAAVRLGIREDLGLPLSALLAVLVLWAESRQAESISSARLALRKS